MAVDQVSQGEDVGAEEAQVEENDTSTASSSEEQTSQEATGGDSASSTKAEGGNFVPYDRFREVNEKAKSLEEKVKELEQKVAAPKQTDPQTEAVKEQLKPILKEMGFVEQADIERQKRDEFIKGELSRLEKSYDGTDGKPKFAKDDVIKYALDNEIGNLEVAYKALNEKELLNWQIKQAQLKSKGIKTETSDGSGSANVGTTDADLKESIKDGNKDALRTYLKRVIRGSEK